MSPYVIRQVDWIGKPRQRHQEDLEQHLTVKLKQQPKDEGSKKGARLAFDICDIPDVGGGAAGMWSSTRTGAWYPVPEPW